MARRSAGTGARTPTASPPGARPAGPCRSGPAPARRPWRASAARATTTDAGFRRAGRGPRRTESQHHPSTTRLRTLGDRLQPVDRQTAAPVAPPQRGPPDARAAHDLIRELDSRWAYGRASECSDRDAMADVHNTVVEPALVEQLELGVQVA